MTNIHHILLIEPDKNLRESLELVLTTTGGYAVKGINKLPEIIPSQIQAILIPAQKIQERLNSSDLPVISTTQTTPPCTQLKHYLGHVSAQQIALPAFAEQVRLLLLKHLKSSEK
ncbi:hypothetical protein KIH87_01235 [Paraneptunicella aestuarii]|uniref:hypothetical protein n=1 Tax=Paraneptunicella aestuarii TaxID=2831148 RepID=UPI001E379B28|nr:hypothetical protein [Paraneptunicella aestuarii]UAA39021.1 hypothetical protein KIH87_01235 [Paraneptunicella aestuarii]